MHTHAELTQQCVGVYTSHTAHHTPGVAGDELTLSQASYPILMFGTNLDVQTSGMGNL